MSLYPYQGFIETFTTRKLDLVFDGAMFKAKDAYQLVWDRKKPSTDTSTDA